MGYFLLLKYRPMTEHGALSEVMAAVLYLPNLDGDGGVNLFGLLKMESLSSPALALETAMDRIDPKMQVDD